MDREAQMCSIEALSAVTMKNRLILGLHGVTFQKMVLFIKLVVEQVDISAAAEDHVICN
jgi:hypothetical protein